MKIMFFTDSHGNKESISSVRDDIKILKADLAVCAGDLTLFEQDMDNLLDRLDKFGVPVLMIPGNHESEKNLKKACEKFKNVIYANKSYYENENVFIMLIEANGFAQKDKEFEKISKKMLKELEKKKRKNPDIKFILVTHAPPYNTNLDNLNGMHVGNNSIRKFIKKTQPIYAISGHIHENERKRDTIGKTKVINPGMYGMLLRV